MAATRLSQLPKRLLRWVATDTQHTRGLVGARKGDTGNISHSLRTLET